MTRTTNKDLEQVCSNLNRRLAERGSKSRVIFEGRYGYVGVDETDTDGNVQRTLTTGNTKAQAYEAMWNMIRALDLLP